MFNQYTTGRIGVFIDEANLFHSQKTLEWKIDYQKLYWILRDLNLFMNNIFLYTSFLPFNKKQNNFIGKLVGYGFIVHSKKVKEIIDKKGNLLRKGNLDIELALDAFQFSYLYDTIFLFSGDSDFAYLCDLLKEKNKKIIVVSTRHHISKELLDRADLYIDLKKLRFIIEKSESHKTTLTGGIGSTTLNSLAN